MKNKQTLFSADIVLVMLATFLFQFSVMSVNPLINGYAKSLGASSTGAGFVGIALLIIGAVLTSITDQDAQAAAQGNKAATLLMLLLITIGYVIYNAIPRVLTASGIAIFFPESVGMVIGVLIYLLATQRTAALREPASWRSLIIGLVFSVASLTYILSVRDNGVNTAFVISQLSVVISTLGGFVFLHERKSRRGYAFTSIGLVLIVVGAVITSVF